MKRKNEIVAEVLEMIGRWTTDGAPRKLVIGVDGVSAAGKTTLLDAIAAAHPDILPVKLDRFLAPAAMRRKLDDAGKPGVIIGDWQRSPWFRFAELEKLLAAYRTSDASYTMDVYPPDADEPESETFDLRKPVLLLEGTMLLNTPARDRLDRLVYLDMPHDTADQLRRGRISEEHRHDAERKAEALRKQPDWSRMYRKLFDEYLGTFDPKGTADLVVQIA